MIALGGGPTDLSLVATGASVGLVGAVLIGGVAADRIPQKRILVAVEAVKAVAIGTAAVLALTGSVEIWHLAVVAFVLGVADGFFYPAYSALLPSVLPADELLAANGIEGMLRPTVMQAAGPALSSAVIAAASPAAAMAIVAVAQLLAVTGLADLADHAGAPRDGRVRAPGQAPCWSTSGTASATWPARRGCWAPCSSRRLLILLIMGPIEVLLPFAVKDQTGGGAGAFALAIGAFGIGGAVGSLLVASLPLPRRYLTLMVLLWGVGSASRWS